MSIAIEEDHLALLDSVRRFTADRCTPAVARAAMDAEGRGAPPFWDALAGLGWLGLAVPEADGGEGYGLAELVVVLEELGRAIAPGPVLPTVWAAAVRRRARPPWPTWPAAGPSARWRSGGSLRGDGTTASGTVGPVLCGAHRRRGRRARRRRRRRALVRRGRRATSSPLRSSPSTPPAGSRSSSWPTRRPRSCPS